MSALVVLLQSYQAISEIEQRSVTSIASIFVYHSDIREYHKKKTGRSEMLVAVNVRKYKYCDTE
jgi:hypothetical protein